MAFIMFQSTYLYKVRRTTGERQMTPDSFNPRTYIRYDTGLRHRHLQVVGFNPRTYIRYDFSASMFRLLPIGFNPRTYIRYDHRKCRKTVIVLFQSTYLYKVRRKIAGCATVVESFNPRTYIRYDNCRRPILWI